MEDELELYETAAEEQMQNAVAHLDDVLQHIRAGKANPRLLDPIKIDYYGTMTPLSNCATVVTPDARTIAITPWEKKLIGDIERAIINSNIGLTPSNIRRLFKGCAIMSLFMMATEILMFFDFASSNIVLIEPYAFSSKYV